jgi:hypothetical protein
LAHEEDEVLARDAAKFIAEYEEFIAEIQVD